jgi:hypothetical protein
MSLPAPSPRRSLLSMATFAVLVVGLAACGSSGSSTTGASASTGTQFQARLNLAKCLRAHGLNVPDPTAGGGPAAGFGQGLRSLDNYPTAQVNAARQACQQYIAQAFPQANLSPAQRAQRLQQLTKFTQCMRAHGVNIPDPTPTSGGGGFGIGRVFRSIDRNSPAFQSAMTACGSLAPQRFGRGGGSGGAGGVGGGAPGA